jgi:hypothetical protein
MVEPTSRNERPICNHSRVVRTICGRRMGFDNKQVNRKALV